MSGEAISVEVLGSPSISVDVRGAGAPGMSAYQLAVAGGFVGAEAEWLASLQGPDGPTAVSADAGNIAVLGTDSLVYVPATVGGASNWGDLGGTLSDQTDLQAALDAKADTSALGTAATHAATDFATAAQGAKADSAVQPGSLATVATTGAYTDLTGRPTLGTAAAQDSTAFATAAQGAKADTALQSAPVTSVNTKTGAVSLTASDVGAYVKPGTGIPKTDLETAVQTSLGKADTALQSADIAGKLDTSAAPELIRDTIGTALVAGSNVTITVNDPGDTITIAAVGGSSKSVQHDTSGGYDYTGVAAQGTPTSSSGWTITRMDLSSPSTAAKHASGAWTNRASLTYT